MENRALGDVAEFVRGINFKPDDVVPTGTPGSVACMRTKNVQTELDLSDVWSVGEQFVRRENQFLQGGDVLVSSANSWNLVWKCCWIPDLPGRASFGGFVSVLRPHRAKVEPRFLYRWFSSDRIQTTLRSFGQQTTNISNLNIDRCLKLPLPLPPLAEQRRIAEVLDRAESLRAKRRAALAQLDSFTQSLFGDPVANPKQWPNPTLGGLLTFQQYGPRFFNESYSADGIRIVRITDLNEAGNLDFSAMPRMTVSKEDREKYSLRPGDIIFAGAGATVDKVALMQPNDPPCIAGAYFITMRFEKNLNPLYARAVLIAPSVRAIVAKRSRQAAQQNLNGPGLRQLPMPLPPHLIAARIRPASDGGGGAEDGAARVAGGARHALRHPPAPRLPGGTLGGNEREMKWKFPAAIRRNRCGLLCLAAGASTEIILHLEPETSWK